MSLLALITWLLILYLISGEKVLRVLLAFAAIAILVAVAYAWSQNPLLTLFQLLLYTSITLMFILFTFLLLQGTPPQKTHWKEKIFFLLLTILWTTAHYFIPPKPFLKISALTALKQMSQLLSSSFLIPFEALSFLLLLALIIALHLIKR